GTPVLLGCTDPNAVNFNGNATTSDGSCIYEGCTDAAATNFNSNATVDNGSCEYCNGPTSVVSQLYICTFSNGNQVALTIVNAAGDTVFTSPQLNNVAIFYQSLCLMQGECYTAIMSNSAGLTGWYNGYFWVNNGQVQVIHTELAPDQTTQSVQFSIDGTCGDIMGCTNPLASNYNSIATVDDGTCILVEGCTDSTAVNYNPLAVLDNGSCFSGCDAGNAVVVSFNPGVFAQESLYTITNEAGEVLIQSTVNVANTNNMAYGCLSDGCYTLNMFDSFGDGWDGGNASGIVININGVDQVVSDMTAGNYEFVNFGINSDCVLDTVPCSTSLDIMPDSLNNAMNTIYVLWNEDLNNVAAVEWSFGDGVGSNDMWPTYYYDTLGTYTLCVTVYFLDGCSASECVTFTMNADGSYGPGGIQNNGFWLNVIPNMEANVNELEAANHMMYPNPVGDVLNIQVNAIGNNDFISVYGIDGQLVLTQKLTSEFFQLNTSALASGVYMVQFNQNGNIETQRFIKK
ncbi:MAG: T9SS type A sorting domain-containing protein, partial [Bacteroidetes bacterium]|nr:T9SS type A sorting domain-containing protein [Bacteroidota bacterium]